MESKNYPDTALTILSAYYPVTIRFLSISAASAFIQSLFVLFPIVLKYSDTIFTSVEGRTEAVFFVCLGRLWQSFY